MIVILQGDVVLWILLDTFLPAKVLCPVHFGHLTGSALYVLGQEQKAQGLCMVFVCPWGWLLSWEFHMEQQGKETFSGSPAVFKLCVFIEINKTTGWFFFFFSAHC